ncbi:MAG: HNH endonuclease [Bacilli bacterium]|nr:HNH endonuclease [Bacilli bacterium]
MGKIRKEINELPFLEADDYGLSVALMNNVLKDEKFNIIYYHLNLKIKNILNDYGINSYLFGDFESYSPSNDEKSNEKMLSLSFEKTILHFVDYIFGKRFSYGKKCEYETVKQELLKYTSQNNLREAIYELFLSDKRLKYLEDSESYIEEYMKERHKSSFGALQYLSENNISFDYQKYLLMDEIKRRSYKNSIRKKIKLTNPETGKNIEGNKREAFIYNIFRHIDICCLTTNKDDFLKTIFNTMEKIYNNYDKINFSLNDCSIRFDELNNNCRAKFELLYIFNILELSKKRIDLKRNISVEEENNNIIINKIDNKIMANLLYILDFFQKNRITNVENLKNYIEQNNVEHGELYLKMYDDFNKIIEEIPSVKQLYEELPNLTTNNINIYKRIVENYINESIVSLNSESVDKSEIKDTIDSLKEEIRVNNLGKHELNKKKQQLLRLNLVFEEIPPNAIQKGLGAFKKYYVYYYESGMVALDIIDEYGALYIMPITVYNYIIKNDIQKRSVIQSLPGVNHFSHSTTSKTWKEEAKDLIINGVEELSDEDIMINSNVDYWNFKYDLSNYDRIKNDINNNTELSDEEKENSINIIKTYESEERIKQEQIIQKRKEKIKQAKAIDKELKESEPESDVLPDQIQADEDELELQSEGLSFQELFEASKKIDKKAKRSAAVSKYCKDRTMDMEGLYHCECCGETISPEEKYMLDTHHLKPISEGGPDTIYNAVCLCNQCHRTIHRMPERVTPNVILKLLDTIERHLIDENPEFLEEFYDYKKQFFTETTLNDKIIQKRNELNDTITNEKELDEQVEKYAEQLSKEYENKSDLHRIIDNNFAMNWHNSDVIIK